MPKALGSLVLPSPSATKRNRDSDRRVRGSWCLCPAHPPWTPFQVHRVMGSLGMYTEDLARLVNNCFSVVASAAPPRRMGWSREVSKHVTVREVGAGRPFSCSFSRNFTGFVFSLRLFLCLGREPERAPDTGTLGEIEARWGSHLAECQSNASCRDAKKNCAPDPSPH